MPPNALARQHSQAAALGCKLALLISAYGCPRSPSSSCCRTPPRDPQEPEPMPCTLPHSSMASSASPWQTLGRVKPPELHLPTGERESLWRDPELCIFSVGAQVHHQSPPHPPPWPSSRTIIVAKHLLRECTSVSLSQFTLACVC